MQETYVELVRSIEIVDVTLQKLTVERFWGNGPMPEAPNAKLSVKAHESCVKEREVALTSSFDIHVTLEDEKALFRIEGELVLHYQLRSSELNTDSAEFREALDQFGRSNAPAHFWPYLRELVSSLSVRMGFPALIIGTYKMNV